MLFSIGSVLFIATAWATIAYLLTRVQAARRAQVLADPEIEVESERFTERFFREQDATP